MKKLISLGLSAILMTGCASNWSARKITNPSQSYVKPSVMDMTCAHLTLEAEKYLGSSKDDFRRLDSFLDKVSKRAKPLKVYWLEDAEDTLKIINDEISQIFTNYQPGEIFYDCFRTGKADCERFSMLYMAVAERLNLPMVAVLAQGGEQRNGKGLTNLLSHLFVRWKFSDPVFTHLNWEVTQGKPMSDDFYESEYLSIGEMSKDDFRKWCVESRLWISEKKFGANYEKARKEVKDLLKFMDPNSVFAP